MNSSYFIELASMNLTTIDSPMSKRPPTKRARLQEDSSLMNMTTNNLSSQQSVCRAAEESTFVQPFEISTMNNTTMMNVSSVQTFEENESTTLFLNTTGFVGSFGTQKKLGLNYGTVVIGQQRTLNVIVRNMTDFSQELMLDKLPSNHGFSVRDVMFAVPSSSTQFMIPVSWAPLQSGPIRTSLIFLWKNKIRIQVALCGNAVNSNDFSMMNSSLINLNASFLTHVSRTDTNSSVLQPQKKISANVTVMDCSLYSSPKSKRQQHNESLNASALGMKSTLLRSHRGNVAFKADSKEDFEKENRTVVRRTSTATTSHTSMLSSSTKIAKTTKMNDTFVRPTLNAAQIKRAPLAFMNANTGEIEAQRQKRREEQQQALQKMKTQMEDFRKALPSNVSDLVDELTYCIRKFQSCITPNDICIQGYNDVRVSYLLQWVQICIRAYNHPVVQSTINVDSFSSPSFRSNPEMILKLLTNQYRVPAPLTFEQLFPSKQPRHVQIGNEFDVVKLIQQNSSSSAWNVTLSPTKVEPELEQPPYDEKEMILKVAYLFQRLSAYRKKNVQSKELPVIQGMIARQISVYNSSFLYDRTKRCQSVVRTKIQRVLLDERKQNYLLSRLLSIQSVARTKFVREQTQSHSIRYTMTCTEKLPAMDSYAYLFSGFQPPVLRTTSINRTIDPINVIQNCIRRAPAIHDLSRRRVWNFLKLTVACQSLVRKQIAVESFVARKRLLFLTCMTMVQSAIRRTQCQSHLAQLQYIEQLRKMISCQSVIRTQIARNNLVQYRAEVFRKAVAIWQCSMRGTSDQSNITKRYGYTKVLQRVVRMKSIQNSSPKEQVTLLQSSFRQLLSRQQIQQVSSQKVSDQYVQEKSALTIQKIWRGHRVRQLNAANINEIRKRILHLAETVEERQLLKNRTRSALNILLNSKQMTLIMQACANLDVTTRLSTKCCESAASEGAVPILFSLIKTCNRSKPHMILLQHLLNIILHLSSNGYTAHTVFECREAIPVLVEQLQMYRDKEDIFMSVLSILNLHSVRIKRQKQMSVATRRLLKQVQTIAQIMDKKYQIDKKLLAIEQVKSRRLNLTSSDASFVQGTTLSQTRAFQKSASTVHCYEALMQYIKSLEE